MCITIGWLGGSVQLVDAQTSPDPSPSPSRTASSQQSSPAGEKPDRSARQKPSPPHGDALPDREILAGAMQDFDPSFYRDPLPLLQVGEELARHVSRAGTPEERHATFLAIPDGLRQFVQFHLPVSIKHEMYRIQAADFARRHPKQTAEVAIAVSIHSEYSSLISRRDPVTGQQLARDVMAAYDVLYAQTPNVQDTFMEIVSELVPYSCAWSSPAATYLTTEGRAYLESIIEVAPSAKLLIERIKSRTMPRPDPAKEKRLPNGALPQFDGIFYCRPGVIAVPTDSPASDQQR